jgi:hypothetical protein
MLRPTLSFFALLASGAVLAENRNPILDETWSLTVGGYDLDVDATVATQSSVFNQRKFKIDLDDLGLETDVSTYWIDAKWKPFERWSFLLEYFSYSENASRNSQLNDSYEFTFRNKVFKGEAGINTTLNSQFDVDIYSLSAAYRVFDSQKAAVDIGVGLHAMDINLSLSGRADVYANDAVLADEATTESETLLAPLPNIMIYGAYAFNKQWAVNARIGWLSMNYNEYSGDLLRANTSLEFRPIKNLGLGIGYNLSELDVTRDQLLHSERFDLNFSGPLFYLKGGF